MFYVACLIIFAIICFALHLYTESKARLSEYPDNFEFVKFQRTYLVIYCLAVAGDWLQGPYVYVLYEYYGMNKHQIELLFIAGFLSSLVFGTFVGSIADKYGRRNNCFLFAILYCISCITKHFADFTILLAGRIMGGIATSILFSAFESWLVNEHNRRGLNDQMLKTIFSNATLSNSIIAILAGIVAQVSSNFFGYVAPFDCAIFLLVIMMVVMMYTWPENYGDNKANVKRSFITAYQAITNDKILLFLGCIQSFFEGAMYTFVLEWTPALTRSSSNGGSDDSNSKETIPYGYIFASFMFAVMMGSALFRILSNHFAPESFMRYVLVTSALALGTPILFPFDNYLIFISFAIFELCVGIFWPAMGYLRSQYVSEENRSTTMNFFRIPLNMIVILILWQDFSMDLIFQFCVLILLISAVFQHMLFSISSNALQQKQTSRILEMGGKPVSDDEEDILIAVEQQEK